jgi:hypothetical protein
MSPKAPTRSIQLFQLEALKEPIANLSFKPQLLTLKEKHLNSMYLSMPIYSFENVQSKNYFQKGAPPSIPLSPHSLAL